jgi:dynein heavy chain
MTPIIKAELGKGADLSMAEIYSFFVTRVRSKLHVVLAFSPIGDAFRDRLRKFPSLVNCCTIDWFQAWPADALVAVAEKFLQSIDIEDAVRDGIVASCQHFHSYSMSLSAEFESSLRRVNYVTPTSYLELITSFKTCLEMKRSEVLTAKRRYEVGLDKLGQATLAVNTMQVELEAMQPNLRQSQKDTNALMEVVRSSIVCTLDYSLFDRFKPSFLVSRRSVQQ